MLCIRRASGLEDFCQEPCEDAENYNDASNAANTLSFSIMQILPSRTPAMGIAEAHHAMPHTINLAQLLDVQVEHLPRPFSLIPLHRLFCLQRGEPRTAKLAQGAKYTAAAKAKLHGYRITRQSLLAQT
jgi:hypothetical protein